MKKRILIGLFIAAVSLGCACGISACNLFAPPATTQPSAPDARQKLTAVTESATFILNGIADARDAGLIKQADIDKYKAIVDAFVAAKNKANQQLKSTDTSGDQAALEQVNAALAELQPLLQTINTKKKGAP
jgi:hypothetical protein